MKKALNYKSIALIIYLVSLVIIGDLESETNSFFVRYYKYTIAIIPIFLFFLSSNKVNLNIIYSFLPIIFIFIWSFVFNIGITLTNFSSIIVLLSVLPAFFFKWNYNFDSRKIKYSFYIIGFVFFSFNIFTILNQNFSNFMLSGQSSNSESFLFPFILGIISFYFFLNKQLSLFIIFFILTFLTGKRSVFLALVLISFVQLIFSNNVVFKYRIVIGLLFNLFSLLLIYFFSNGFFNDLLNDLIGIKSIGSFSAGRSSINSFVFDYFRNLSISDKLFGIGFGEISKYIGNYFYMGNSWNAHNEILRLLVEIGVLGLILFVYLLYKYTTPSTIFLLMFLNIIMLFTNVFIYPVVIFLIYIIAFNLNEKKYLC